METTSISRQAALAAVLLLIALVSLVGKAQKVQKPSRTEMKVLIAGAQTAGDHERLAALYREEAESLKAKQREHEEELQEYYKHPSGYPSKYPNMGDHCRDLAQYYAMAAQKALVMADMHNQMAQDIRGHGAKPK